MREGLTEWEEKSGSWEKRGSPGEMWSELSSVRKWLLGSCQVKSQVGAVECLCESVCEKPPQLKLILRERRHTKDLDTVAFRGPINVSNESMA